MRVHRLFAVFLLLGAPACAPHASTPTTGVPALPPGLPATRAHELACALADASGPRLAGSQGDALSRAWGLAEMRALGLAKVREEPVTVPHWERGPISVAVVSPAPQPLVATALGGSIATPPGGITAEVIRVESLEALDAIPEEQVRGKIVFFDRRMEPTRDLYLNYGDAVSVRSRGAIAAARKGAVASVIRSIATGTARFPHTGAMRYAEDVPKIPAAALAVPDADLLARLIARGTPVRLKLELAATQHPDAMSGNVIGEVTGREKPDEIVLVGAHLDSWDLGPGAVDDAAGVGVVLEVARLLKAAPPRRTVRIVLFANEENGLKGAFAYAKDHAEELPKHQAALEIDAGAGPAWFVQWHAGDGAAPAMLRLLESLRPLGVEGIARDAEAGGADLIPLTDAGVPKLELKQDATRYFDLHHAADDTCDKIVPEELAQVTAVVHRMVREVADMPDRLPFAPPPPKESPTAASSPVPSATPR